MRPVSYTQSFNSFKKSGRTVVYSDSYQQVILHGISWYVLSTSIIGSTVLKIYRDSNGKKRPLWTVSSKSSGCATRISEKGRLIYTLLMKTYKQVGQQEWEEGWNQFWNEEGINNGNKKRKAPPALWQTGRDDIDEQLYAI